MVKPIYWKSIAIGLAGILLIVALFLFSAYMADRDMKESHRMPGPSNDFAGVIWWVFFFFAVPFALAIVGALSAWASSRDVTSIRGTFFASALAGGIPIALIAIVIVSSLIIAFVNTPDPHGTYFSMTVLPLLSAVPVMCLFGLSISIMGGFVYVMLARALYRRKIRGPG
jgi:hypothetical protein